MNQKFTVQVLIEFSIWPTKDDIEAATAEACAKHMVETVFDRAHFAARVLNATVTDELAIPVGRLQRDLPINTSDSQKAAIRKLQNQQFPYRILSWVPTGCYMTNHRLGMEDWKEVIVQLDGTVRPAVVGDFLLTFME